jgi:hypothetical protein
MDWLSHWINKSLFSFIQFFVLLILLESQSDLFSIVTHLVYMEHKYMESMRETHKATCRIVLVYKYIFMYPNYTWSSGGMRHFISSYVHNISWCWFEIQEISTLRTVYVCGWMCVELWRGLGGLDIILNDRWMIHTS